MRVAALYDIHGNLPALEAVLGVLERERVDLIVCGGDVVPGPLPGETLARLRELGGQVRFVMGNGDREVVEAYDALGAGAPAASDLPDLWRDWTAARLSAADRHLLSSFETAVSIEVEGLGRTLFCHASPRNDTDVITALTDDERLAPMLAGVAEEVIVCGHTHSQFGRAALGRRIFNAGAVGMPYEGTRGAFWALLGPDVRLMRTEYDVDAAVRTMAASGFPQLDEMLEESLLEPADRDELAQFFERQATSQDKP